MKSVSVTEAVLLRDDQGPLEAPVRQDRGLAHDRVERAVEIVEVALRDPDDLRDHEVLADEAFGQPEVALPLFDDDRGRFRAAAIPPYWKTW